MGIHPERLQAAVEAQAKLNALIDIVSKSSITPDQDSILKHIEETNLLNLDLYKDV